MFLKIANVWVRQVEFKLGSGERFEYSWLHCILSTTHAMGLMIVLVLVMMTMTLTMKGWRQGLGLTRLQGPVFIHQTHPTVLYSSPYSQLCICIFPHNCIHALSSCVYSHLYSSPAWVHTATESNVNQFDKRFVTYQVSHLHIAIVPTCKILGSVFTNWARCFLRNPVLGGN